MERRLHHLALGVSDLSRVAAFYREELGLEEVARHADTSGTLRSIWLALGDGVLMLERTEAPPLHVEGIGRGPFLLALAVTSDERAALEATLAARGHAIESRTAHTSYLRDPEGNRVALSDYPLPGVHTA